jgi:hypothetical protein
MVASRSEPKQHYDVEMIRDFLEHLRCEYANLHFESTHQEKADDPELTDQLAKYQKKYNTVGLRYTIVLDDSAASNDETERAVACLKKVGKIEAERVLQALNDLEQALDIAFKTASPELREKLVTCKWTVEQVLEAQQKSTQ